MDHHFNSCTPFDSNNNPDQPVYCMGLPTIPYDGVHTTQTFDTMPARGDINPLIPGQPISSYTYPAVPGIQQGPAIMPQIAFFNSISPFQNNEHRHLQQSIMSNTGLVYDKHSTFDDEGGWMQFALPTIDSKLNNENQDLEISDQISSPTAPAESTASKKCEWKGCTFPRPFRRDAELMRHIKTVHVARDAYKCPVCGRGFGRKDRMEDHRRTHTYNHALGGKTLLSQIRDRQ